MKKSGIVISWLLVLLVMVIIFSLSAQVAEDSSNVSKGFISVIYRLFLKIIGIPCSTGEFERTVSSLQNIVRKTAHFVIYAILGFLFSNAYLRSGVKKVVVSAVISSAVYAATDEFHQLFVEGRSGEIRDILIDTSGALTGALLFIIMVYAWRKIWKKHLKT